MRVKNILLVIGIAGGFLLANQALAAGGGSLPPLQWSAWQLVGGAPHPANPFVQRCFFQRFSTQGHVETTETHNWIWDGCPSI